MVYHVPPLTSLCQQAGTGGLSPPPHPNPPTHCRSPYSIRASDGSLDSRLLAGQSRATSQQRFVSESGSAAVQNLLPKLTTIVAWIWRLQERRVCLASVRKDSKKTVRRAESLQSTACSSIFHLKGIPEYIYIYHVYIYHGDQISNVDEVISPAIQF